MSASGCLLERVGRSQQNKGVASVDTCEISGVLLVRLRGHGDERGRFMETFRQEWFPDAPPMVQGNRSDSTRGTLRGLHYHLHQADYWYVPTGTILVALNDLRRSASSYGKSLAFEIGEKAETGVYIPPGVAHGFQAVTDATLTYLVDNYYDPDDENGLAWDDPDAGIPWPIPNPLLSDRDKVNPKRSDIPEDRLPS
jgi:dTDP-4-dehydrorhamnose 3,5-epimerase